MPGATSVAAPLRSLKPTDNSLRERPDLLRLRLLDRRIQVNTKAEVVVEVVARRLEPVAVRRPTIPGGAVPTANTVRARFRTARISHAITRVVSIRIVA